ncbi:MAG TPA: helix-hairpin-helix domain-containing protein [Candidatus Omnitrophota bacterium]|nr:helix-hairpin-helix domain-containing protein [Candidatus Omnitrophota bacterium]HPD84428.1 helix-hairpin-helix domain-containing protein [Candidatus Omnitrophota bacterium]HRZ03286.1 helix-hairpin-helix domain-containing protein [Candidatus Omnitrophota bacterium]
MFNLTKEERLVLIFFIFIILFGTLIHWALKSNGRLKDFINIIESDKLYSRVDINTATYEDLVKIPYLGSAKAKRIIDYRIQNGLFGDIEQVKLVPGIGNYNYRQIAKFLKVSAGENRKEND